MTNDKLISLKHLQLSAMRSSAQVDTKIAELTEAVSEELIELDNAKQEKLTGTPGDFVVIGSDGKPTTMTLTNVSEVGA